MTSSHRNAKNVRLRSAKICKAIRSNYKIVNLLDRASKVVCIPFFSSFITLAVDFIRNYSKFYTYISRKLIAFTPWNEIDFFFKKLIFDRDKDKN